MTTGLMWIGLSSHIFRKLSLQLTDVIKAISSTILDLQLQLDSSGSDHPKQKKVRSTNCKKREASAFMFLQKKGCSSANKLGIVHDKIKKLQEDLERKQQDLQHNLLWTDLQGFLLYFLPLLGSFLLLILLLTTGTCLFNKSHNLFTKYWRQLNYIRSRYTIKGWPFRSMAPHMTDYPTMSASPSPFT